MRKLTAKFGDFEFPVLSITQSSEAEKAIRKISETSGSLGLDIETAKITQYKDHSRAGLCPHLSYIRLLQIYDGKQVWVFDLQNIQLSLFKNLLSTRNFIGHNAKFELLFLTHFGIPNVDTGCSMLMSQLITNAEISPFDPDPEEENMLEEEPDGLAKYKRTEHSLEAVSGRHLGIKLDKKYQKGPWEGELTSEMLIYAGADAFVTYKIGKLLYPKIITYKMEKHYKLLKATQHAVVEMELEGIGVDWEKHSNLVEKWDDKRADAQRKTYPYFKDTNLSSSKQMCVWLERYFRREPDVLKRWPKTPKGAYSFNAMSLSNFKQVEPIKHLLEYKEYQKLVSTYGEGISKLKHPKTSRLHSSFIIGETRTGRMSSREPNGQNFPRDPDFRSLFIPKKGCVLIVSDLSQIELRAQAELSGDPVMKKVYKEGKDIYKVMAASLLRKTVDKVTDEERQTGKIIMLAMGFGMGPPRLEDQAWKQYGVRIDGKQSHAMYRNTFKHYISWCDKQRDKVRQLGYGRTVLGKMRRMVPDEQYTRAVNFPVQGSCAEVMMIALCKARRLLQGTSGKLVSSVHDEVLIECSDNKTEVKNTIQAVEEAMNGAFEYIFPKASSLKVAAAHAGRNWLEAK